MSEPPRRERILKAVLVVTLVVSLVGAVYVVLVPQETSDPRSEFYILGPEGKAENYPTNLTTGEPGVVILGVSNQEHQSMTYTAFIVARDETLERRQFSLADGATWQEEVQLSLEVTGETRVEFLLYKGGRGMPDDDPYRELYLLVTVSAAEDSTAG